MASSPAPPAGRVHHRPESAFARGFSKSACRGPKEGLSDKDPTLPTYSSHWATSTGQFGKNHLGDRNEFLPTVHGFDEFFGNLYHLNAEDEPENPDYPKNPEFKLRFGPRGVLKCTAPPTRTTGRGSALRQVGQTELRPTPARSPRKRMETIDEEFLSATLDFIDRAPTGTGSRSSAWFNSTPHAHLDPSQARVPGKTGLGIYPDGMVEHDAQVGQLLKKLDDLGIANNTIVIYTTDNGAETFTWPDGGTTPFRGEKNTNWEGGYRVPALVRWPGLVAAAHRDQRHLVSAEDWVPTLTGGGRRARHQEQAPEGLRGRRQDLQGPPRRLRSARLARRQRPGQRREFFYWTDDGNLAGLRYDQWKAVFMEQQAHGLEVWHAAVGAAARADAVQPALRPVRAGASTRRAITSDGSSTTSSCWYRRRRSSGSTWRRSRTSRRGRSRAASRSTRPWRS